MDNEKSESFEKTFVKIKIKGSKFTIEMCSKNSLLTVLKLGLG